jgi:hypothetical protein
MQLPGAGTSPGFEIGGAVVQFAGSPPTTLTDWSVLARYFSSDAPESIFANTLADLGDAYRNAAAAYAEGVVRRDLPADAAQASEGAADGAAAETQAGLSHAAGHTLRLPILLGSVRGHNIVAFNGLFYGVPQRLGPIKLEEVDIAALPEIICGTSEDSVKKAIEDLPACDGTSSAT